MSCIKDGRTLLRLGSRPIVQWQKISGGDWSTYAADVSRRSHAQERARAGDQRAGPLPSA
jgi:hypothetical protein